MIEELDKVLFVPSHRASLKEMILIAGTLSKQRSIFYVSFELSAELHSGLSSIKAEVINATPSNSSSGLKFLITSKLKGLGKRLLISNFLINSLFVSMLEKKLSQRIKREEIWFRKIFERYNVKKVVVANDRSMRVELSIAKLAQQKKLEIVVASFAISADTTSIEKLRKSTLYYYESTDSWNSKKLVNGKRLSFFKQFEKNVIESLGIMLPNPWVLGSGYSTCMMVDSEREKRRLIELGGDASKYIVTGQISHDRLYGKNIEIASRNKPKNDKKRGKAIIILAVPQYYEHGLCGRKEHFEYVSEMISLICKLNCELILSLHPKMNKLDYERYVDEFYNLEITDKNLCDVLPECDLFISTYSSTVAWAILCNKKLVIVDHICLDYEEFFSEFQLPIAKDNLTLIALVENLINFDVLAKYDEKEVERLSPFDGKCASRIASVLG